MTIISRMAPFLVGSAILAGGCAEGPVPPDRADLPGPGSYIVYYGSDPVYDVLDRYDWAIVANRFVPERHSRTRYFAYLSIGEVDIGSGIERELERRMGPAVSSLALAPNAYWHSWVADIRSPVFQSVLEARIRDIEHRGFGGVFLDTLDSPAAFEEIHPRKGKGLRSALIEFIRMVRRQNPSLLIVVNRGFSVLPDIAGSISGVLFEDFCSLYDPARGGYALVPPRDRDEGLSAIGAALQKNPRLVRLALDYGDPGDSVLKRTCRDMARHAGFIPFFSNRDLTAVR